MQLVMMLIAYLLFNVNLFEINKNASVNFIDSFSVSELKLFIFLNQIFGLFLPALFFLLIYYKTNFFKIIDLGISSRAELPVLALAILLFSYPAIQFLVYVNGQIPISDWMSDTSLEIQEYMLKVISMDSKIDLITNIGLIALVPAISEELFFRGMLQKELLKIFRKSHVAIVTAAVIFSAFHFQFEGFLPRLGLGLLLGYAYFYTKSFFVPFLMHFTNNAIMVVAVYLNPEKIEVTLQEEFTPVNYMIVIVSFIVVVSLFKILKNKKEIHEDQHVV
jgi:membrane protease YdiL (CAAX protease family)